ncbi:hypothetical protein NDU88_007211 [Pleurodeles waltl]|uniref:Uncharacterized protein n=1 Tax=Pleurodeles waltl TaxID=8319 RepID=A0AAV7N3N4_PLEWA|nr:hypothetical protein NDU88_007211 [Pleurodeles waltl]
MEILEWRLRVRKWKVRLEVDERRWLDRVKRASFMGRYLLGLGWMSCFVTLVLNKKDVLLSAVERLVITLATSGRSGRYSSTLIEVFMALLL